MELRRLPPGRGQIADPLLQDSGANHDELLIAEVAGPLAAVEEVATDPIPALNDAAEVFRRIDAHLPLSAPGAGDGAKVGKPLHIADQHV